MQKKYNKVNLGQIFRRLYYYRKNYFFDGNFLFFISRRFEFSVIGLKSYMVVNKLISISGNGVKKA
jgi:hypothetical protein